MVTTEERLSHLEGAYEHLATKADVQDVRVELANVRVELAKLRAYVETALKNQTRWFAGILIVQTGVIVGLLKLLEG